MLTLTSVEVDVVGGIIEESGVEVGVEVDVGISGDCGIVEPTGGKVDSVVVVACPSGVTEFKPKPPSPSKPEPTSASAASFS